MSVEERPWLEFVAAADTESIESNGVVWRSGVNAESTSCSDFEYGTGSLQVGHTADITPGGRFDESACESAALITSGEATVTIDGETSQLTEYDVLFAPPGGEYTFENRGESPVNFLWGVANQTSPDARLGIDPIDHDGIPQVVHTLRDIDVSVTLKPGHCSRLWSIAFPETVGSRDLTMGIIKRPPGSVAPLHKHDPSTLTEAFTVIDGRLLITDQDGRDVVLDPGDFMYIPERGMHQNKSIHVDETTYAFIENPARGRDASPIDSSSE